jgi:cysteine desulfurase
LCAGFGAAAKLALESRDADRRHIAALWAAANAVLGGWTINGSSEQRYRGNLNIRRQGLDAARLISECRGIAFSAGSACASGSGRPSHVLTALGLTKAQAASSIRIGFGRYTTESELIDALQLLTESADRQMEMSA